MNKNKFTVKFRGVRGSYPTPDANMLKYGGNTACVEVRAGGHLIILDAGTGIINIGDELARQFIASGISDESRASIKASIFFSHAHSDHIQGFPFFKPAYINTTDLNLFGASTKDAELGKLISDRAFSPHFPLELSEMNAKITINNIKENEAVLLYPESNTPEIKRITEIDIEHKSREAVIITNLRSYAHPKHGVLIFKISWMGKNVVYATDKESYVGGDSKLINFSRNTDLLIHDAQYTLSDYTSAVGPKQGFGHSTPEMAVETAELANAKRLALYHLDPSYSDEKVQKIEEAAIKHFPNSFVAHEGLEIEIL